MKNLVSSLTFMLLVFYVSAQDMDSVLRFHLSLDNAIDKEHLFIDTTISNSWMVGAPSKPLFNSAKTSPNAIVTKGYIL